MAKVDLEKKQAAFNNNNNQKNHSQSLKKLLFE